MRHAHVHNPRDILYGRLPRFRLSEEGRRQAECTARFIAARRVTALYTSPLLRARQTAEILAAHHPGIPVRRSSLLIETRTSYQGSPNSILKAGFSFYDPLQDPNDESMQAIFERMLRFLRLAARRHAGHTIVAVSHADPITIMRLGLRGREFTNANLHSEIFPDRASVTQLTLQPGAPPKIAYFRPTEGLKNVS